MLFYLMILEPKPRIIGAGKAIDSLHFSLFAGKCWRGIARFRIWRSEANKDSCFQTDDMRVDAKNVGSRGIYAGNAQ